jgi:acyl-CoA dehydrogenase
MDYLIGGQQRIGQGWRMLMDCLAAGRAISLPALGTAATIFCARYAGAYARIRRQFGISIGRFEGVEEPLARIAGYAYSLEAARKLTADSLDAGEQPSVLSAILKYHATERMRTALNDALDIHGGRGICDGPSNYLFGVYQSVPVAITVEGANILTRNLMIFGQGAIRCHPHLLNEMKASMMEDAAEALAAFDKELWAHVGNSTSSILRAFWHNLTGAIFAGTPEVKGVGGMYRHLHAACVTFAAAADLVMGTMGGGLKRREGISARLGDVLSELYILSAVLKRFELDGMQPADLPLVEWNYRTALFNIQRALDEVFVDLPNRPVAWFLRLIAFPWGRRRRAPRRRVIQACANIILNPGPARERLTQGIFRSSDEHDATGLMEAAFEAALRRDAIEAKLKEAGKSGRKALSDLDALVAEGVMSREDADSLTAANALIREAIMVDDFAPEELIARDAPQPGM